MVTVGRMPNDRRSAFAQPPSPTRHVGHTRRDDDDAGTVSRSLSRPKRNPRWHIVETRSYTRQLARRASRVLRLSSPSSATRPREIFRRHPARRRAKMNRVSLVFVAISLYATVSTAASAGSCKYSVESYTTTDAMIVTEAAFISQVVTADCEDPPSNLYAEVDGKLVVAANAGPNKYQVSNAVGDRSDVG